MITLVVFSKDRAMQLDSLLRSVKDHCTGIDWVTVIYQGSTDLHFHAYQQVAKGHDFRLCMYPQHGVPLGAGIEFEMIRGEATRPTHIALAVDDQLFYRLSDFAGAAKLLDIRQGFVWSWRLGHPAGTFTLIESHDVLGEPRRPGFWQRPALDADLDYGYLWHSDGSLYKAADYTKMLDRFMPDWRTGPYTPNDLEAWIAARKPEWAATVGPHLGPLEPTCITWQLNRVQTKYGSPAAEIPETNTDALARAYLEGKRVDNDALYGALCADPFRWNPPGARPTHVYACEAASKFWASCVR